MRNCFEVWNSFGLEQSSIKIPRDNNFHMKARSVKPTRITGFYITSEEKELNSLLRKQSHDNHNRQQNQLYMACEWNNTQLQMKYCQKTVCQKYSKA